MRAIFRERFGDFGGRYVAEILRPALDRLEREWLAAMTDGEFRSELDRLLADFAGRPTPLMEAVIVRSEGTVKLLLDRGADTALKDARGRTARQIAEKKKNREILALFDAHEASHSGSLQ